MKLSGDMPATKDDGPLEKGLRDLFDEIDPDCRIVTFEKVEAHDKFALVLRTKLPKVASRGWGASCDEWVGRFSAQTASKYIVKSSCPRLQRMEFRKLYICKENNASRRSQGGGGCDARIDVKVKKVTAFTVKRDALLREGYNAVVKVNFRHSHERR